MQTIILLSILNIAHELQTKQSIFNVLRMHSTNSYHTTSYHVSWVVSTFNLISVTLAENQIDFPSVTGVFEWKRRFESFSWIENGVERAKRLDFDSHNHTHTLTYNLVAGWWMYFMRNACSLFVSSISGQAVCKIFLLPFCAMQFYGFPPMLFPCSHLICDRSSTLHNHEKALRGAL